MRRTGASIILLAGLIVLPGRVLAQSAAAPAASVDPVAEVRAKLAAAEAAHPGNTPEIADALMALVQRERITRQIGPETDALAQRALDVSSAAAGKDSILYASALASRAKLYVSEDRPEQGRPLAEQALEIARRVAPGTNDMAMVADALDKICWALHDKPCALHAAEEAVAAIRASGPGNDLYLASMLQDMAQIQLTMQDVAGARAAMIESAAIVDRQDKPAPSMAVLESNAGAFFSRQNQPDEAMVHLKKSLALSEKLYGPDSVQVAYATRNLGGLDEKLGRSRESAEQYDRALALFRKWYGPTHTYTANAEEDYARALAQWGTLPQALDLALHAQKSYREYSTLCLRVMPMRQALELVKSTSTPVNVALSIVARHPELGTAAVYQEEIRSRGLVAEEMARRQASLNRSNDPQIAELLKELDNERSAAIKSSGSTATGAENLQAYNDSTVRMEHIERTLAERQQF